MQNKIKPIETVYDGYRFRSRLEARWAVFFNAAGIRYQYEPEGFVLSDGTWYLPDFYLPSNDKSGMAWFVEVKGERADEEGLRKAKLLDDDPPWGAMGCYVVTGDYLQSEAKSMTHQTKGPVFNKAGLLANHLGLTDTEYNQARRAALSARFEHGEAPNV